ncbi:cyclophane-forming radical SAM peptide maturase AmcB [Streptomyces sp. NPDC046385]|uniref:cyclophane-forming radical SAM peptide maturase AmcB n=1 Tax=unclassified Streptomyces TaxID=2593676 RepID=UPI0033D68711
MTIPDPPPGAPSRALRVRAAAGWERFMRRTEEQTAHEAGPDGYERHPLLHARVRDTASGAEGELTAVTHELHSDGRVVRIAHIRAGNGIEWTAAADNIQAARPQVRASHTGGEMSTNVDRPRLAPVPRAVVMQPTTLCQPMDCTYCYLPFRRTKHLMPQTVAEAVAQAVNGWAAHDPAFEVVWHGGEPLSAGREHLAALMTPFDGVKHTLQTNAALIDDAWCAFLREHDVHVGVSIDGPEDMNTRRVTLAGRPGFRPAMRGIDRLRRHGIPFSAIAVVSDPDPAHAARFYEFFVELGVTTLGVNVEEEEGVNRGAVRADPRHATEFWQALADAWSAAPVVRLRELSRVMNFARAVLDGQAQAAAPPTAPWDPLPTVAHDGGVVMLSPELAGFTDDRFGDFTTGNVLRDGLDVLVAEAEERTPWITEFWQGVDACRATCPYFAFCGGAHPANRYFEHGGRMDGTRTRYCSTAKIALIEGVTRHAAEHRH